MKLIRFSAKNYNSNEILEAFDQHGYVTHHPPPLHMSTKLLLRVLAYKLQELELGGLKPAVRRFLEKASSDAVGERSTAALSIAKPGTRLIREWRGVVYEVIIEPDGVILNGERLKSLTEAAHKITGAKWSGPRFFGLVKGR